MRSPRRFWAAALLLGVLVLGAMAVLSAVVQQQATAQPGGKPANVTWAPESVDPTAVAGESSVVGLVLSVDRVVEDVNLWLVPELDSVASVVPMVLSNLEPGVEYDVALELHPAADAELGIVEGALHVREGAEKGRTLASPLPITVEVVWPHFVSPGSPVSVAYPPWLEPVESTGGGDLYVATFIEPATEFGFSIESRAQTVNTTDVEEWADAQNWPFPGNWRDYMDPSRVGTYSALHNPEAHLSVLLVCEQVIYIRNGIGREGRALIDTTTFDEILQSVEASCG